MPRAPHLTVRAIRCVGVEVPMTYALGTSRGTITKAPLLLIDLDTEEGITGRSYLWCYFPAAMPAIASILGEIERTVKGETVAPVELWAKLAERFALIGVQGIVRMAMSGIDMAAWDALAIALNVPLATLIGGKPNPIPAYNSCGLGLMAPEKVADEAEKLLSGGFRAIKLRLGYPTLQDDLAALHAVRKRVGDGIAIMVDYNQALGLADALARGRALDREGIDWLEEPIRHDDYQGYATLVRELERADPDRGEFLARRRHGECARGRRRRLRDAGPRTHRRRHRLAARRGTCRHASPADVVPSVSGGQRAPARRDADLPLPRICRLGRQSRGRAAAYRRRLRNSERPPRQRTVVGRQGGGEISGRLTRVSDAREPQSRARRHP